MVNVSLMAGLMMLASCEKENSTDGKGVLPGAFSVSATHQVHFSQGNLQYRASTNTWRFAEHQYDCVGSQTCEIFGSYGGNVSGSDNLYISSTYDGWIDLFGWGTSGWNSGAVCYQPWSTSITESDYYPGGSFTNGLTGAYVEADWAWHNAISNGGKAHQWRTLTKSEWFYLLERRTNAFSKRRIGNINGVGGLIILPDSWTQPSGCPQFNQDSINYTLEQWAQMEAAGAVFLPAAGVRCFNASVGGLTIKAVAHVGIYGWYWSSTPDDEFNAYCIYFRVDNDDYNPLEGFGRDHGYSVRPVRD